MTEVNLLPEEADPPQAACDPWPVLTPEEHTTTSLTPRERDRRAELLAPVRSANHPPIR